MLCREGGESNGDVEKHTKRKEPRGAWSRAPTFCVVIVPSVAIFPLQPNQVPDLSLRAAFTATSSPPARALAFLSGTETRFETTIS